MRLFIAFDVSGEAKNYLIDLQKQLPDCKSGLVNAFHLTLKFLGEVDDEEVPGIISCLKTVKFSKFTAKTHSLGVFPSEKMVRVVWICLTPEDRIINLQESLSFVLPGFSNGPEFRPHITLARIKFIQDKPSFIRQLKSIKIKEIEFEINSFKLIRSSLTPEGSVYEVIEEFQPA